MNADNASRAKWYEGVTPYMWLVLLIASLGWVFDVFEGQVFVASMNEAMPSLLPKGATSGTVDYYNNIAMGAFLVGGALGGVLFGMISDKIGRTRTMVYTILMYSLFTCVTALAQNWWQMTILRFLVALGTGGEWAVASAMVAEVFPKRARAWSLGIFHASSVLGTYLAVLAGSLIMGNFELASSLSARARGFGEMFGPRVADYLAAFFSSPWRLGFLIGALPALLTLWIRWRLREPDQWKQARERAKSGSGEKTGRIRDLFAAGLVRNTLVGLTLATIGLATYWGVHIYGRELLRRIVEQQYVAAAEVPVGAAPQQTLAALSDADKQAIKQWEMLGMFLVTTGGGLGLLAFGPISERIGRRGAFLFFQLGGLVSALIVFLGMADATPTALCWMLPVFGFLTLGVHAGYAIYFPELFPTRLRGTGGGFCFNGGRFLAASILVVRGWMRSEQGLGLSLENTAAILSLLFLAGALILLAAPETKGRELPT